MSYRASTLGKKSKALLRLLGALVLSAILQVAPAAPQAISEYLEQAPGEFARAAFLAPYGQLHLVEFSKFVQETADQACLQSRGFQPVSIAERGQEIFARHGTRMIEIYLGLIDFKTYDSLLAASAGAGAKAEMASLRATSDVKSLIEISRPAKWADFVNVVVEAFDRYRFIKKIRPTKHISPLATGNATILNAHPMEQDPEAIDRYIASHPSRELKRWIELSILSGKALLQSTDKNAALNYGPLQHFAGLENDLTNLCVR